MLNKFRKRAQVGDTLTWFVATLIIVILLIVFVYVASALAGTKKVVKYASSIDFDDEKVELNWIGNKTEFAFEINFENKNFIEAWINEKES